jgi:hypothetical protein
MRQGERESSKLTDVVCKRRGCRNRLTVIALQESPRDQRYCSRQCAGFGARPSRERSRSSMDADLDSEAPASPSE